MARLDAHEAASGGPRDREAPLRGRVAIVTGGAQGIGRAIAHAFAASGAAVAILDFNEEGAARTASEIATQGGMAVGLRGDVSSPSSCREGFNSAAEAYGQVDVLVNNAGIASYGPSAHLPEADWRRDIDVMLGGTFFMTQAVAPGMLSRGGGAIVNIASISGMGGWPMRAAYSAAKAGIISLTETLASEWGHAGVRVNAISPGVIRTEMVDDAVRRGVAWLDRYEARTPKHELGETGDIAAAAVFLASSKASAITGVTLRVDGGWVPWANPDGLGFPEPDEGSR